MGRRCGKRYYPGYQKRNQGSRKREDATDSPPQPNTYVHTDGLKFETSGKLARVRVDRLPALTQLDITVDNAHNLPVIEDEVFALVKVKCNYPTLLTLLIDETESNFLLQENENSLPSYRVYLCPETNLKVCNFLVPTLLDSGVEVSCMNEDWVREIESLSFKLPILPVPNIKIIGVTSRSSLVVSRQTVLTIEGLGMEKLANVLM
ncbi:hypothetical protein PR048_011471 [Dryococelus australis]|uniref:Uncharacterized protein n=1 Tax=Dryococelus australis TaxID=614101 RepID=A0ABQ9HLQ4_9NEOP|nr:hypothetical protein PR048_011471 [Dryococelus australis]